MCDLVSALDIDQPKTSRNLAKLRESQILQGERKGKWMFYRLHPELPDWAKNVIRETADKNHRYLGESLSHLVCCRQNRAHNC
ncbi:MAG: hypothetical protein Alis3KO_15970 [Aliiglaciecola sp.]